MQMGGLWKGRRVREMVRGRQNRTERHCGRDSREHCEAIRRDRDRQRQRRTGSQRQRENRDKVTKVQRHTRGRWGQLADTEST